MLKQNTMADTPEELKKLRGAFEAKVNETAHDLPLARYFGGIEAYRDSRTNNCWEFYQAAYALGLSDMQERAAKLFDGSGLEAEFGVARRIRALPKEG